MLGCNVRKGCGIRGGGAFRAKSFGYVGGSLAGAVLLRVGFFQSSEQIPTVHAGAPSDVSQHGTGCCSISVRIVRNLSLEDLIRFIGVAGFVVGDGDGVVLRGHRRQSQQYSHQQGQQDRCQLFCLFHLSFLLELIIESFFILVEKESHVGLRASSLPSGVSAAVLDIQRLTPLREAVQRLQTVRVQTRRSPAGQNWTLWC